MKFRAKHADFRIAFNLYVEIQENSKQQLNFESMFHMITCKTQIRIDYTLKFNKFEVSYEKKLMLESHLIYVVV